MESMVAVQTAGALASADPVAGASALMRYRDDTNFFMRLLIDDAVRKASKEIAAACTSKYGADLWTCQNRIYGAFKLFNECQSKLDIGARCIERRCVM